MIIRNIHIDGFGIFRDFSIGGLRKGINIIEGRNEAGKSTLLAFLRYTLFGYPRTRADHREPLQGGRHGGRITGIVGPAAEEVTFERFAGPKGGPHRLLTRTGESGSQVEWERLLGGATGELYQNVYAFSLDELVSLDKLSLSGVEDRIFSIGLGLGDLSLGEVEKNIQSSSDAIFLKRGRTHQVSRITERIGELNSQAAGIREHLQAYQDLAGEIQSLETGTRVLEEDLRQRMQEQKRLETLIHCYPNYVRIRKAEAELNELPALRELPVGGPEQLNDLEIHQKHLEDRILSIRQGRAEQKGMQELEGEIRSVHFNAGLLGHRESVDYLRENLSLYRQEVKNRAEDLRRVADLNEQVTMGLSRVGQGWTETHLTGFADMEAKRARLQTFKNNFESLNQQQRDLETEVKLLRSKEGSLNLQSLAVLIAAVLLLGSFPAFYYGLPLLGAALLLAAAVVFLGRNRLTKQGSYGLALEHMQAHEEKERALLRTFGNYLESELHLSRDLNPGSAMETLGLVLQLQEKLAERDRLRRSVQEARDPFITGYVVKVQQVMELLDGRNGDISAADGPDGNQDGPDGNQGDPGGDQGGQDGQTEINVNRIIGAFEEAERLSGKKQRLEEALERAKRELQDAEKERGKIGRQIADLLKALNAENSREFRDIYERNERVSALMAQVSGAAEQIEHIAGLGKAEEVMAYLDGHEKAVMDDRIAQLHRESETYSAELQNNTETLGRKRQEIRSIEGESELSGIMSEMETEKEKLRMAHREWLTNKLALKILNEVKSSFEKEKQPEIIQYAGRYFKTITGGRYDAVRVSLGEKEVSVFDQRGAARGIDQLSRGTREQLLVSLRLGFIEAYEKKAEPLPVIVDEILVNFDAERAAQTAEILQEFAKERQILLLTCHESTAGFFRDPHLVSL